MDEAKISIQIEGSVAEIHNALAELLKVTSTPAISNGSAAATPAVESKEVPAKAAKRGSAAPKALTHADIENWWSGIKTAAREILAEMAKRPEGYLITDLAAALNKTPKEVGGSLSSVGHAARRLGFMDPASAKEWIYNSDRNDGVYMYTMKPQVAEQISMLATQDS